MNGLLADMARLKEGRAKRISSYDRTGGNADYIKLAAGETVDIAKMEGAGIVKHIWITLGSPDPMRYRNIILRMYWDGEKRPSVQSPLGDFFGQGWGEEYTYSALPMCVAPRKGLNCYLPMPFEDGARMEIENDSEHELSALYYYVDYEERDAIPTDTGRFHAEWRRRLNVSPEKQENEWVSFGPQSPNLTDACNHVFVEARGRGHYVGINYYVDSPTPLWYGEGDDMFVVDGEPWPPSLHGTGTEDYFNSAHCPREVFCHPYFGYPRVTANDFLGRTHCYRYHIEDPIMFRESLRGSIEAAHANALTLDIATVAYWYQTEPHKPLAGLPNRKGRENMPKLSATHIHRWREAWRQLMGGEALWGHEGLPKSFLSKLKKQGTAGRRKLAPNAHVRIAKQEAAAYERMLNRRKKGK